MFDFDALEKEPLYHLDHGLTLTQAIGRDSLLSLRDRNGNLLATLTIINNEVVGVRPYEQPELDGTQAKALRKLFRRQGFALHDDAAYTAGYSKLALEGGAHEYLAPEELSGRRLKRIFAMRGKRVLVLNGLERGRLSVPSGTAECALILRTAAIRKVSVGKNCRLLIDLKENERTKVVEIGPGFVGSADLSRSNVRTMAVGNNCRLELTARRTADCLRLSAGDLLSGRIEIEQACFDAIDIGRRSDAAISLKANTGQRRIKIADGFKGRLELTDVSVREVDIGRMCRGLLTFAETLGRLEKIAEESEYYDDYEEEDEGFDGVRRLSIADGFCGKLRVSGKLGRLELGGNAKGKVDLFDCRGLKVAKFDENFHGEADLSHSGVVYVRASRGFDGKMDLSECPHLALLKIPELSGGRKLALKIDREPMNIRHARHYLYCQYLDERLPERFFTPLRAELARLAKRVLKF